MLYALDRLHAAMVQPPRVAVELPPLEVVMTKVGIMAWTEFELATELNEPATVIGSQLFHILECAGYSTEDIACVARTLFSYVD